MNSKELVRSSIMHKQPDRVPADFACVEAVIEKPMKYYGFSSSDQVYDKFNIDIRYVDAPYIGPELKHYYENGDLDVESYYGYKLRRHWTGRYIKVLR